VKEGLAAGMDNICSLPYILFVINKKLFSGPINLLPEKDETYIFVSFPSPVDFAAAH